MEGGCRRTGSDNEKKCRQSGPSTLNPETSTVGPVSRCETGKMEGVGERTWPKAKVRERKDEVGEVAKDGTHCGGE